VFVSDVDGTLTESEVAEFPALAVGKLPLAHPHAAMVFKRLTARGLVPIYLTARPEWLMARTRAFLEENEFPPGIVCTQRNKSGGYGASAAAFKKTELERIAAIGVRIDWAFGNMPSDAHAYSSIVANARQRVLLRYEDEAFGARRIESYEELLAELNE
jgi:phosphatidate phosphatase PAH1